MTRLLFSSLMILQVLICPFLGRDECQGGGCAVAVVVSPGCQCCSCGKTSAEDEPTKGDERPNKCDFCNCFCSGAIQPDVTETPTLAELELPQNWVIDATASDALGQEPRGTARQSSPHFPPNTQGRSVCALTESYCCRRRRSTALRLIECRW